MKKQSTGDLQKVYEEKQKVFEQQLNGYKAQIVALENRPKLNSTAVIIAIIIGLVLGYLLRGR